MKDLYFALAKEWCDTLLTLQVSQPETPSLDGGILCPSCGAMHGRSHDVVFPLLFFAEHTGEEKYLKGAKHIAAWTFNNLGVDDGSFVNERFSSPWKGITVFAVIAYCEALRRRDFLLDNDTLALWKQRIGQAAEWCYLNINFSSMRNNNVNYPIACAAALASAGIYFNNAAWKKQAQALAHRSLDFFTEEGLLFGEGAPMDATTAKGCRPIDIGYNVEESLPLLALYAHLLQDEKVSNFCKFSMTKHLEFMLPDGAWDNSIGSRNFKWSYWGSRTSDGCQLGYALYPEEKVFTEAAHRNTLLLKKCTHHGLLHGGPHYPQRDLPACTQHSIFHAKSLTMALDLSPAEYNPSNLPSDIESFLNYYPSLDTWKISKGPWRATVSGYDFFYLPEGHASGGCLSLLWHNSVGPLVAAGMSEYRLIEPGNMQYPFASHSHRPLTPRLELLSNGTIYSQMYDAKAKLSAKEDIISVDCQLVDKNQNVFSNAQCHISYQFTTDQIIIQGQVEPHIKNIQYLLPIISKATDTVVQSSKTVTFYQNNNTLAVHTQNSFIELNRIYNLVPGFEAIECIISPDATGAFSITITCSADDILEK